MMVESLKLDDAIQYFSPGLDRYGATDPAEFLAVLGEVFFETPAVLQSAYPQACTELSRFFRQDPLGKSRE